MIRLSSKWAGQVANTEDGIVILAMGHYRFIARRIIIATISLLIVLTAVLNTIMGVPYEPSPVLVGVRVVIVLLVLSGWHYAFVGL